MLQYLLIATLVGQLNPLNVSGLNPWRTGGAGGAVAISMDDDVALEWGTGKDYWLIYDSSDTRLEFWTSDSDGGGADKMFAFIEDGTDDWVFVGGLEILGTTTCTTPDSNVFDSIGTATCPPTSDAAPGDLLTHSAHSFPEGSQIASEYFLGGGIGPRFYTATAFGTSTNDTLDITVGNCASGVCTTNTTTLTESTHWDCDLVGNNECACALYAYLAANLPTGISSVSRSDGTCTDSKVFLTLGLGAYKISITTTDDGGGGVWGTATNSADGIVIIPIGRLEMRTPGQLTAIGTATAPAIQLGELSGAGANGLYRNGNELRFVSLTSQMGFSSNILSSPLNNAGAYVSFGAGPTATIPIFGSTGDPNSGMSVHSGGQVSLIGDNLEILNVTEAAGVGTVSFLGGAKGASLDYSERFDILTFAGGGGGSSLTTSGLILRGDDVRAITTWILVEGSGCTSLDLGDGVTVDLLGNNVSVTAGSTTTADDATAEFQGVAFANEEITVTAVGGNCVDTSIRVRLHYENDEADNQD